jgi:hypothetical protein
MTTKTPQTDGQMEGPAEPVVADTPPEPVIVTDPVQPPPLPEKPRPVTPAPRQGSGLLGALLGGALAAVGGFALSHFDVLDLRSDDTGALQAIEQAQTADREALARLAEETQTLTARLATLEGAPAPDLTRLDDLQARLDALEATPPGSDPALANRLADLERQIAALPSGGADAAEVEAALARLSEVEAEAQARAAEAEALAAGVARTAALDALSAAVASGAPFEAELQALGDEALQTALQPLAVGVAPLSQLQADFPEAARAALQAARDASAETGWTARLTDFLADQTGARPLTPQEGTTPAAILSRAEFALNDGRLPDALTELQALDPAGRAPMEPWITAATARVTVESALAEAR